MKQRKNQKGGRSRLVPLWTKAEIAEFDGLLTRLIYPNKVVRDEAQGAMGLFALRHGTAKCNMMAEHLDANGVLEDGPCTQVRQ